MGRPRTSSLLSLAVLLLMAAAIAEAAASKDSTGESQESRVVANEGRSLKACPRGFALYRGHCYCQPGYGYNRRTRRCVHCSEGWYKEGYNFDACKRCRSGSIDYLVDEPIRSKCQAPCERINDGSTTYWKGYVAVSVPTWYYDWSGTGRKDFNSYTSAAEICASLEKEGYPNYVPAIIQDDDRDDVNELAKFHFQCYKKRSGMYYWAWQSYNDNDLDTFGQCERVRISDGVGQQLSGKKCFPRGGSQYKYPVICSKGCDKWCISCKGGKCEDCAPEYTPDDTTGECVRDETPQNPKD